MSPLALVVDEHEGAGQHVEDGIAGHSTPTEVGPCRLIQSSRSTTTSARRRKAEPGALATTSSGTRPPVRGSLASSSAIHCGHALRTLLWITNNSETVTSSGPPYMPV